MVSVDAEDGFLPRVPCLSTCLGLGKYWQTQFWTMWRWNFPHLVKWQKNPCVQGYRKWKHSFLKWYFGMSFEPSLKVWVKTKPMPEGSRTLADPNPIRELNQFGKHVLLCIATRLVWWYVHAVAQRFSTISSAYSPEVALCPWIKAILIITEARVMQWAWPQLCSHLFALRLCQALPKFPWMKVRH